jgi:hypothetical protein
VVRATFDDPNLVSCAGLEPVMRLAESCDLHWIVREKVHVPRDKGSNAAGKVATIVAGMVAGADSIDDLDVMRHGGMPALFGTVYAPSTLGSFLREFTHGHVLQLQSASREFLVQLARRTPLLSGAEELKFVDVTQCCGGYTARRKAGGVRTREDRRVQRAAARLQPVDRYPVHSGQCPGGGRHPVAGG